MDIASMLANEGIDPDQNILLEILDLEMTEDTCVDVISGLERLLINVRRLRISPKQVFENSLPATVRAAKNAEELLLALKFACKLSETGIDPGYSLRYGIPSVLESISDKNLLTLALDSGLSLAKQGIDPWALLHYSVPALSKDMPDFEANLREIQHLCFRIRCRHQDYLHQAIASILKVEGKSKIRSLRLLSETLEIISEKERNIKDVLQSIPSLADASSRVDQLEKGLEVGLAMAKKGMEPADLLKLGFPRAIEITGAREQALDLIVAMAKRLIAKNIDPQYVLRYSIQSLMKFSNSAEDLEKGILALESLVTAMSESNINGGETLFYGLRALSSTCKTMDQFSQSLQFGAKLAWSGIDPCDNFKYGVAWTLGDVNQAQFKSAIDLAVRLKTLGIDPLLALQFGIPVFAKLSGNHDEFEKGMILLEKLLIALEKHKSDSKSLIISVFSDARSYTDLKTRVEKIEKLLAKGVDAGDINLCIKAAMAAHKLEFDRVMDSLIELTGKLRQSNMDPWVVITYGIPPALAALRNAEEFELAMKLINLLVERQIDPGYHLEYGVPAIAHVASENEFREAIRLTIKLVEHGFDPCEAMCNGIPALRALNEQKFLSALKAGIKMAEQGINPEMAFKIALPPIAERRDFEKHMEAIFEFAAQLKEKKVEPSNAICAFTPALAKVTENAESFKSWCSRFSDLSPKLLDVCLKNSSVILDFFVTQEEADWDRFIVALDIYSKGYWGELVLDTELISLLSSPALSIPKCVKSAEAFFISRSRDRAAELGIRLSRLNHEDCIGLEALRSKIAKKDTTLERILEKIARYGNCYNYFQEEKPPFYLEFKRETENLANAFDSPGVKFHVNYKVSAKMELKSFAEKMPITSDIKAVKELIVELKSKHSRIYNRFSRQICESEIKVRRPVAAEIVPENLEVLIKILLKEIQSSEIDERPGYVLVLIEAYAFRETEDIRRKIAAHADPVMKLNLLAEYWGHCIRTIVRDRQIVGQKFYDRHLAPLLNEKADIERYLSAKTGKLESGTLSFVLSERGVSDLSKGDVSQDCLKDRLFIPGVAHIVDPAFLLFKIFEGEEWIGNVYAAVCKDLEDKNVLLIDNIPIKTEHPILSGRKEDIDNFAKEFLKQTGSYARGEKFDYAVIAHDCSPRIRIRSAFETSLNRTPEKILLRKAAGHLHFSEFEVQTEFLQALGKLEAKQWHEVNGYII